MSTESRPRLSALVFAERARKIASNRSAEDSIAQIVQLALDSVDCEYASVTLVHADGTFETVASSHPVVDQADALQYELNEGPCLTAAETNGLYVVPETATEPRWPNWGPRAAALGLHSILSIHLFTDRQVLGALNLYARPAYQYTEDDIEAAQVVAAHASVSLARSRSEQNLWRAVDSRHVIGQAQGVLMERHSLTAEQAFSVLKRYSQQSNVKLHEVAVILLRTGDLPGQSTPSTFVTDAANPA
ncbi:GAF and ANTAR domain-containing protein [Nakamurella sp. PAMC28650]|jgi:GAF domain-containing protein|uniref:GAF and ANTAR domain-containing protein n=1 Tax=Nakamurella sp. PAMC28650 TaxID=2762325 RepID=UPI00164E7ADE|nr:GAF and ANTAR domain-containing protein [Nakamurella sp. PAMC28650]QNK81333.1 GAF and ANTAR domain-containing protein [Nakamurella sp. PAMC28650]